MKSKGDGIGDSGSHEMVTRLKALLCFTILFPEPISQKVGIQEKWVGESHSATLLTQFAKVSEATLCCPHPSHALKKLAIFLEQELPKISWAHFATESSGELREEVGRATWRDESLTSPLFTSKLVVDGPNRQFQISPGHAPLRRPVH